MEIKALLLKLLDRKQTEPRPQAGVKFGVSWPLLFAISLVLVCAVGWAFFMGLMVGRGQNPQASLENMAGISEPASAEAADGESQPPAALEPLPEPLPMAQAETAPKPASAKKQPPRQSQQPQAKERQYDYVFQVAALRNQADAKKVSATLSKNGFKSATRKDGKVWLATISLRGGASEVAAMQKKLRSLKMGKAMQLSKKAVEQRAAKRKKAQ